MIETYIPQAAPFVMIDELIQASEAGSITKFAVIEDNIFVEENYFTEPGIIENMAQTAAAGTGYIAQQSKKNTPVGFIGAIKNCQINQLPVVGDILTTEVTVLHSVLNAKIIHATVTVENKIIASSEFKIFLQNE